MWLSQPCCFGFIYFFWCKYLFRKDFLSIGEFWSCCCLSFHWLSNKLKMGCQVSSHSLWLYYTDWGSLCDHLRDVPLEDAFTFSVSAAASDFFEWFHVGIDVYIPHRIRSNCTNLHGFQLLVLLPQLIEITFFVCTNTVNIVNRR